MNGCQGLTEQMEGGCVGVGFLFGVMEMFQN